MGCCASVTEDETASHRKRGGGRAAIYRPDGTKSGSASASPRKKAAPPKSEFSDVNKINEEGCRSQQDDNQSIQNPANVRTLSGDSVPSVVTPPGTAPVSTAALLPKAADGMPPPAIRRPGATATQSSSEGGLGAPLTSPALNPATSPQPMTSAVVSGQSLSSNNSLEPPTAGPVSTGGVRLAHQQPMLPPAQMQARRPIQLPGAGESLAKTAQEEADERKMRLALRADLPPPRTNGIIQMCEATTPQMQPLPGGTAAALGGHKADHRGSVTNASFMLDDVPVLDEDDDGGLADGEIEAFHVEEETEGGSPAASPHHASLTQSPRARNVVDAMPEHSLPTFKWYNTMGFSPPNSVVWYHGPDHTIVLEIRPCTNALGYHFDAPFTVRYNDTFTAHSPKAPTPLMDAAAAMGGRGSHHENSTPSLTLMNNSSVAAASASPMSLSVTPPSTKLKYCSVTLHLFDDVEGTPAWHLSPNAAAFGGAVAQRSAGISPTSITNTPLHRAATLPGHSSSSAELEAAARVIQAAKRDMFIAPIALCGPCLRVTFKKKHPSWRWPRLLRGPTTEYDSIPFLVRDRSREPPSDDDDEAGAGEDARGHGDGPSSNAVSAAHDRPPFVFPPPSGEGGSGGGPPVDDERGGSAGSTASPLPLMMALPSALKVTSSPPSSGNAAGGGIPADGGGGQRRAKVIG